LDWGKTDSPACQYGNNQ